MKIKLIHLPVVFVLMSLIYCAGCSKNPGTSASIVGTWDMTSLRVVKKQNSAAVSDSVYPYTNTTMTFTTTGNYTYAGGNTVSGTYTVNGSTLTLISGSQANDNHINILTDHALQTQYTISNPPYTTDFISSYTR